MTDDYTKDIRERLEKATPGPWHTKKNESQISLYHKGQLFLINHAAYEKDIELIAHAPTDIADLLEEREVLREALKRIVRDKRNSGFLDEDIDELDALTWRPEEEK